MIPPSSPGRGPPFILLPIFTGVPILRVAVGASVIATGKIGGAFHASILCPSRSLSPHFKLVRELSFSIGGRRIFDFIGGVLPGDPSSEEFLFSFFVGYRPTSLAQLVCVASCICFATSVRNGAGRGDDLSPLPVPGRGLGTQFAPLPTSPVNPGPRH